MTSNNGDIDNWDVSDSFGNDWRYSRIWLQATLASAPITAAYFIVFRLHRNWATSCCLGVNSSLVICCCQVLPADYYQVLLSITCHLLLSSITEYHRVLPSISKYYQVLPSITSGGCSGNWLLATLSSALITSLCSRHQSDARLYLK